MVLLQKLTARVFGAAAGVGGNPVTIFSGAIPSNLEQSLAKSCNWECVLIGKLNRLKFFAPSGNELEFCAHAAMGAAYAIHKSVVPTSDTPQVSFQTADGSHQTAHIMDMDGETTVFLDLQDFTYRETALPLVNAESLLDQVGLEMMHVLNLPKTASLAGRGKTMIQVPLDILQEETTNPASAISFENNCTMAQDSTGLYLFSESNGTYECRQFPKASGYPEDPATGIAAAALAVHLSSKQEIQNVWHFRQGTAMGRPSLITVQNIQHHHDEGKVSLQCGGRVEIDSQEEIRV
jgi:trans-2,3-dihydro-3-hydroxyanthranilate isomerase